MSLLAYVIIVIESVPSASVVDTVGILLTGINHSLYLLCMNECLRIPQMSIIESTLQPFREMILWELLQQDKYPANLGNDPIVFSNRVLI